MALVVNKQAIHGVAGVVHQRHDLAVVEKQRDHIVVLLVGHREHAALAVASARILHPLIRFQHLRRSVRVGSHRDGGEGRPVADGHKASGSAQH